MYFYLHVFHYTESTKIYLNEKMNYFSVIYICEKTSHIYIFTDKETTLTAESDLVLQTLRDTPIRIDVITVSEHLDGTEAFKSHDYFLNSD